MLVKLPNLNVHSWMPAGWHRYQNFCSGVNATFAQNSGRGV